MKIKNLMTKSKSNKKLKDKYKFFSYYIFCNISPPNLIVRASNMLKKKTASQGTTSLRVCLRLISVECCTFKPLNSHMLNSLALLFT
jgi:hypothetical protein